MTFTTYYDNFLITSALTPTITVPVWPARNQQLVATGLDKESLHRNIGAVISWSSTEQAILFEWQPSFFVTPEDTRVRPTDWQDCGTIKNKFIRGCRITADTTDPTTRSTDTLPVQIQYDGGILGATLSVTHAGELTLPYTFVPFKGHLVRLVPTDATQSWRLFAVEWEFDIEPEATSFWVTQPSTFAMKGYLHIRDFQLAYATVNTGGVLLLIVDGVSHVLVAAIPSTSGVEVKKYYAAPPVKGKVWQLYGTGTALQIYMNDCEFRIKAWGDPQYSTLRMLGDDNFTSGGAKI
jgi:hypothetical protein